MRTVELQECLVRLIARRIGIDPGMGHKEILVQVTGMASSEKAGFLNYQGAEGIIELKHGLDLPMRVLTDRGLVAIVTRERRPSRFGNQDNEPS